MKSYATRLVELLDLACYKVQTISNEIANVITFYLTLSNFFLCVYVTVY